MKAPLPRPRGQRAKRAAQEIARSQNGLVEGDGLTDEVRLRMRPAEAQAVRRIAEAHGITAGEYVRDVVGRIIAGNVTSSNAPVGRDQKLDAVLARLARVEGLERQLLAQVVTSVWCTMEVLWLAAGDQALPGKRLPERALIQIEDLVSRLEHAAERPSDSHEG